MTAGDEREALRAVADQLSAALGYEEVGDGEPRLTGALLGGSPMFGTLSEDDERLTAAVRIGLAHLALAVGAAKGPDGAPRKAVGNALDGVELVLRGELAQGNQAQVGKLMPSFVFLVTVPIVEQDKAIELSRRTSALMERARANL